MRRLAPSLQATEAFLLAARLGSFQAAAEELALSPSALTRRIQALEAFVGMPLFDRSGRMPRLTQAGVQFRREVEPAIEAIRRAAADLRSCRQDGKIRLITSHSLALGWLMPRLAGLYEASGLDVELTIGRGESHLRSGEVDLALWGGMDDAPDYEADRFMDLNAVPAMGVTLAGGRVPPGRLDDLGRHDLLRARTAPNPWPAWLSKAGYDGPDPPGFVQLETTHFVYESAASGRGIALAIPLLADRFLKETRLRPCVPTKASADVRYGLIYARPGLRRRSDVRTLRDWLTGEIDRSVQAFETWAASAQ